MAGAEDEARRRRREAILALPDDDEREARRAAILALPDDAEDEVAARRAAILALPDDEPAPKRDPWIDPSVLQQSRIAQSSVQRALREGINANDVSKFTSALSGFTPEDQAVVAARAKPALDRFRQIQRAAIESDVRYDDVRSKFSDLISDDPVKRSRAFLEAPGAVGRAVAYPLKGFLDTLDSITGKPLRTAAAYTLNLPQTPDAPPTQQRPRPISMGKGTFGADYVLDPVRLAASEDLAAQDGAVSKALIDLADNGQGWRSHAAGLGSLPGRAVGSMIGAGLTVPMATIGALSEVRPLVKGETDLGTVAGNLWDLAKDNNRVMQEFGVTASMDLSNLLSFGGSSAARNGFRATLAATGDEALAKGVAEALTRAAGTADQVPFVLHEFEKAGRTAAEAEAIFGPKLQHLGQGMLEVGIPFTQISTPVDDTYAFRRFMGQFEPATKAIDTAADVIGANRVYDRVPEFMHAERRVGVALEAAKRDALAAKIRDGIAALPAPIREMWRDKKFRQEFYERAIRPDFERTKPAEQMSLLDVPENPKPRITPLYEETMPAAGQTPVVEPKYSPFSAPRQGEMFALGDVQPKPFPWEPEGMRPKETTDYGQTLAEEPTSTPAPLPGLDDERITVNVPDGKGGFHALTASPDYVPYDQLDATFGTGAQQLFDLIRDTHEQTRQSLVAAGYMPEAQAATDPFSGVYMRRPVQSTKGLFDEVVVAGKQGDSSRGGNAIRKSRVGADEGFPGGLSPSEMGRTPREMGRTEAPPGQAESWLDEPFMQERSTDPAQLWADYVRLYGRAEGETVFRQRVAERFGSPVRGGDKSVKNPGIDTRTIQMPAYAPGASETREFAFSPTVLNIMDNAFAPSSGRVSRIVRSMIPGETALGRGAIGAAELFDSAQSIFKSNVLKSPAYHATNFYNDTLRDVLEGNPNPLVEQSIAAKMIRGEDGPLQIGQLDTTLADEMRTLQAAGLPLDLEASHRFDLDPGTGLARDFVRAAEDPSVPRSMWRTVLPAELGGTPSFRKLGEKNETLQKTTTALFWRSLGASPAEAVARAMSSKIDYQWRQPWEQALASVFPFSKYLTEAPRRTARTMLRRPGSIAALDDFYNAFDRNEDIEPRDTIQESKFMRLGGEHADLARAVLREGAAFTDAVPWTWPSTETQADRGPPVGMRPGYSPIFTIKDDTFDSMRPFQSMQAGAASLSPPLRAVIESLSEKLLATRRDAAAPSPMGLAPFGAGFPDWMTAHAGQNPWATTYLSNYVPVLGARGFQLLGNIGLGMSNEYSPLTVFGGSRDYAPEGDRRDAYAHQLFNFMFPGSLYAEDPASALRNLDQRSNAKQALDNNKAARDAYEAMLERRKP